MAPVLKFLRFSNGRNAEKDLEILDRAASLAQKNEINVEIIKDPAVIRKILADNKCTSQVIYVCFPFEGQIFEKCKHNGFRIIGPQCVISCLHIEVPVPKQSYPVCNIAMLGVTACCSSMKKEERNEIHELILRMGGEVTGDFTSVVTHLIAKEVGSKKYQVASNNKIPIVLPDWVHSTWMKSKYEHFVASDSDNIKQYILPIFKGCTICVTGLNLTQRENIKQSVQENGGVYSGELNMKTCTHLLVEHPTGAKYKYAKQWKLHCVSPSWFFDCLKEGHWLSEEPYNVELETDSTISRPENTTTKAEIQDTMINNSKTLAEKAAENAVKSRLNSRHQKQSTLDNCQNDNRKLVLKDSLYENIDMHNFTIQDCDNYFLDGCEIYLQNKPGSILDCCRKIINNAGGIRLNSLTDTISHVILWDVPSNEVKKFLLEYNGALPYVISPKWLFDSFKNEEMMDVQDYTVIEVVDKAFEGTEEESEVFARPFDINFPAMSRSVNAKFQGEIENDDTTLMNQYLSSNHESTRLSQANSVIPNPQAQLENSTEIGSTSNGDDDGDDDETASMEEEPVQFLIGRKFAINRFSAEHKENIRSLIEEYGGKVTKSFEECDHIIVPLMYHEKDMDLHPKELTLCWLEQCIENEKIEDDSGSFLFRPIFMEEESKPLKGCVVTISQYAGMERQHLFHLVEVLGALAQEYFVRKDSKKNGMTLKASTHLILAKPEGPKYDASLKWGIPCVSKEWLYQCTVKGKLLSESQFSLDGRNFSDDNDEDKKDTIIQNNGNNRISKGNSKPLPVTCNLVNERETSIIEAEHLQNLQNDLNLSIEETRDVPMDSSRGKEKKIATLFSPKQIMDISTGESKEQDFAAFNAMIIQERKETVNNEAIKFNSKSTESSISTAHLKDNIPLHSSPMPVTVSTTSKSDSTRFSLNKSRFSFDFTEALNCIPSPAQNDSQHLRRRASRKSRGSLPLDVQFTEALQRAVEIHVPEEERAALEESMLRRMQEQSDAVLKDCVCVVSKKLSSQKSNIHESVQKLGGEVKFSYDANCTHFIHQGRFFDTSSDYLEAKKNTKCFIVSPLWVEACVEEGHRVNEIEYPITFNPRMSLNVVTCRADAEKKSPPKKKEDQPSMLTPKEDFPTAPRPHSSTTTKSPEKPIPTEQQLEVQKKMEELMEATKNMVQRPRRQTRRPSSCSSGGGPKSESVGQPFNRRLRNKTSSSSQNKNSDNSSSSDTLKPSEPEVTTEQSQAHVIAYDVDPTEREAREHILEQLKRASPSQDIESSEYPMTRLKLHSNVSDPLPEIVQEEEHEYDANDVTENENDLANAKIRQTSSNVTNLLYDPEEEKQKEKLQNAEKYKFLFSGMTVTDKIKYGAIVEDLGGTIMDLQYFSTQCTHVVVHCPTRSEKYLAAVASGKWILHKSFLEASREAAMFVDEENHEWGSRTGASDFYASGKRWRTELMAKQSQELITGAFKEWSVLLCIEASKQPGFKRIIESGGGKVHAIRPPFDDIDGATHAFIGDKKQALKHKVNYQTLHDAGIWILRPEFISDFLTVHPKPSALKYIIEEAKIDEVETTDVHAMLNGKRKASEKLVQREKRHRR